MKIFPVYVKGSRLLFLLIFVNVSRYPLSFFFIGKNVTSVPGGPVACFSGFGGFGFVKFLTCGGLKRPLQMEQPEFCFPARE